jgi:hypothetical protein
LKALCTIDYSTFLIPLTFCYFRPSVIRCSVIFDLGLFDVQFYSTLGYTTFCNFRRSAILRYILPLATFDVQFFRLSVILRSVILPFVIRCSVFPRSVILCSVSRRAVTQSHFCMHECTSYLCLYKLDIENIHLHLH